MRLGTNNKQNLITELYILKKVTNIIHYFILNKNIYYIVFMCVNFYIITYKYITYLFTSLYVYFSAQLLKYRLIHNNYLDFPNFV